MSDRKAQRYAAYRAVVLEMFGREDVPDSECEQAIGRWERQREMADAISDVNRMLASKHGNRLGKFLGSRPGLHPCKIRQIAKNWAKTQGVRI